jgi:purine-binding chemotaxis protein CheW
VYGSFLVDEREFAIPMECLEEVVVCPPRFVRMPQGPPAMLGLLGLRGEALPVLDAGLLLEPHAGFRELRGSDRVAILSKVNARLGIRFEHCSEVIRAEKQEVQAIAGESQGCPTSAILRLDGGTRLVQVLDLDALLQTAYPQAVLGKDHRGIEGERGRFGVRGVSAPKRRMVTFEMDGTRMGMDCAHVTRVVDSERNGNPTEQDFPAQDEFCRKMLRVGDQMVPVLEARTLFGWEENHLSVRRKMLVCGLIPGRQLALPIDGIGELIPYQPEDIQPMPLVKDLGSAAFGGSLLLRDRPPIVVIDSERFFHLPAITRIFTSHENLVRKEHERARRDAKAAVTSDCSRDVASRPPLRTAGLLSFRIGPLFSMPIEEIREIVDIRQSWVKLPQAPPGVIGSFGLRDEPITVIDPRKLFRLPGETNMEQGRILIFNVGTEQGTVALGMAVDAVESIHKITNDTTELPAVFFQEMNQRMDGTLDRGIGLGVGDGPKKPLVVLKTAHVVERLYAAAQGVHDSLPISSLPISSLPISNAAA